MPLTSELSEALGFCTWFLFELSQCVQLLCLFLISASGFQECNTGPRESTSLKSHLTCLSLHLGVLWGDSCVGPVTAPG